MLGEAKRVSRYSEVELPGDRQRLFALITAGVTVISGALISFWPQSPLFFLFAVCFALLAAHQAGKAALNPPANPWCALAAVYSAAMLLLVLFNLLGVFVVLSMFEVIVPAWAIGYGLLMTCASVHMQNVGIRSYRWTRVLALLTVLGGVLLVVLPGMGVLTMIEFTGMIIGQTLLYSSLSAVNDAFF